MNAKKWTHPKTGEIRVYINGFKGDNGSLKVYASADKDSDAVVTVENATTQKQIDNAKSEVRKHFGLYVKFDVYLAACVETKNASKLYGSDYANAYEQATGCAYGE